MCIYRPLPARLFSHIRNREMYPHRSEVETFDITLFDEGGQVLAEIEGFSARRMIDPAKPLKERAGVQSAIRIGSEQPFESADRGGILPKDGVHALMQILSVRTPRAVIAVSRSLDEFETQSPVPSPRPTETSISIEERAAETVEGVLAAWWRDMLGVDRVELDDDFFDLGGHSLVGVRLLAKIKKTYGVEIDLAVLFEARTISQLAGIIHKSK
jgi:acyl carrier protein